MKQRSIMLAYNQLKEFKIFKQTNPSVEKPHPFWLLICGHIIAIKTSTLRSASITAQGSQKTGQVA
jgi:hypothetical protein